jgi:hypothetical protein
MSVINVFNNQSNFYPSYLIPSVDFAPNNLTTITEVTEARIFNIDAIISIGDTNTYSTLNSNGPWNQTAVDQYGLAMAPIVTWANNVYPSIKESVTTNFNKGKYHRLLVTGHGYGGTTSQLIALFLTHDFAEIEVINYTSGSPRLGDYNLEVNLADIPVRWETLNTSDNITQTPFPTMNFSASKQYGYENFPPANSAIFRYQTLNVSNNHDPILYQYALSAAGTPPFAAVWPISYPQILCS